MHKFMRNIFKVLFSNIISLLSGVLVGFLVPKMMGLVGYANYKTYTLYLTYIALLSLGLGDGLYLRFSGIDKEKLDVNQIKYYLHKYYIQLLLIFIPAFVISIFCVPSEQKFICVALSFTILSSQVTAVHQNLSVITSRFNEYSTRVIVKASLTSIFVIILYLIYKMQGVEITYQVYIIGVMLIDFLLAFWYLYTYKEFNFGKVDRNYILGESYWHLLQLGFPLLISNMAGSIFLNFDRQFVSVLFGKEEYAIYAFAYNMLTLITTMTSAVSLVLFPALRKMKKLNVKTELNKYIKCFNMIVALCLVVFFPLCWIVNIFLPKYKSSLEVFRIVLPGLIFSSSVSVILNNFYKYENKVQRYFIGTASAIGFSVVLNFIAYYIWGTYLSISWVSMIALIYWYVISYFYFIKKYKVPFTINFLYIISISIVFYTVTKMVRNWIAAGIIYLIIYSVITMLFNYSVIIEIKHKIIVKNN